MQWYVVSIDIDDEMRAQEALRGATSLHFEYQHPITYEWTDAWDSTQTAGQPDLLPLAVKVTLVLNGGIGNEPLKIITKAPVSMQIPLKFANP